MTVTRLSRFSSGLFWTLLVWGCRAVLTLDNESEQNVTVRISYSTDVTASCRNSSPICPAICETCERTFGGLTMDCLSAIIEHMCLANFKNQMNVLNSTDWCIWENVSSLYSSLSYCTEEMSECLDIPWPNRLVENTFVDIHSQYFKDCPAEEFSDPPPFVVFALVITPICLIPVMVSLVVLKTKNGDSTS